MKKKGWEQFLRLHKLISKERAKISKKKKPRWAEYLAASIPAFSSYSQNEEWVRQLKEKINSNSIA